MGLRMGKLRVSANVLVLLRKYSQCKSPRGIKMGNGYATTEFPLSLIASCIRTTMCLRRKFCGVVPQIDLLCQHSGPYLLSFWGSV